MDMSQLNSSKNFEILRTDLVSTGRWENATSIAMHWNGKTGTEDDVGGEQGWEGVIRLHVGHLSRIDDLRVILGQKNERLAWEHIWDVPWWAE